MAQASPWIAVVDDDPFVLRALKRLLRTRAFHARTYESGQAFLAALPDGLPDCLILDLQMPHMSGLELLQQLTRKSIRIPTIMITAHADSGTRERCEAAGAVGFLSKPVDDETLFAAIAAAGSIGQAG